MPNDFIVRPKCTDKKEDKSITMTIRLERELQEQYDDLSAKSGRSRNELMCMALRYAPVSYTHLLDHFCRFFLHLLSCKMDQKVCDIYDRIILILTDIYLSLIHI